MNVISRTVPRLRRSQTALLIVDMQERLLPAVRERGRLVPNAVRLIRGATLFQLPIVVTEQYRKGLGPTVPEVGGVIPDFSPFEKLTFSACGVDQVTQALEGKQISSVLLCGVETHVCVLQTCLDLLERGITPFVVEDAVSSRVLEDTVLGLNRMREAGAVIVSVEMALFELLGKAGTEEFKTILGIVK